MKVLMQPAYILHARSFRDTSLLLELFTEEHGRVSAVARGARGKNSQYKGLLQSFVPLLVSWYGKNELVTLMAAEPHSQSHQLTGEALLCGFYLNELLLRLLHRYDAHAELFKSYRSVLADLLREENRQINLRKFEKILLAELGYALQLDREAMTGMQIIEDQFYFFEPAQGFFVCHEVAANSASLFSGKSLLALHFDKLIHDTDLRDAKRILRRALGRLLGDKPIKSRELFI